MTLVVVVLSVALGTGRLLGGRITRLASVTFCRSWLLGVALAAQIVVFAAPGTAATIALAVSQVAPLGFLWANRTLPGMPAIALGFGLNAAVILANGAMPVATGGVPTGRHRLMQPGDALTFLADVVPLPPLGIMVSVGDLVLAFGVGVLVIRLMLRLPAQPVQRRGEPVAQ